MTACEVDEPCYKKAGYIQKYLNSSAVWNALSSSDEVKQYELESSAVSKNSVLHQRT